MVNLAARDVSGGEEGVVSLGDRVLHRMRADILTLKLAPGEVISERSLEAAYGASRTPIRQALMALIREGLVAKSDRAYAVAPLDLAQLEEIFEYREIVEDSAIRLACERATPEALDRLQETVDRGLANFTPNTWFEVGLDVHVQLAALSGNRFLADAVQDAVNRTLRTRWLVASSPDLRAVAHREHCEILNLVRARDAENAAAAVRRHGRDVRIQILEAIAAIRHLVGNRGIVGDGGSA
ncbi:GntR family transcriptional regulator [Pararhizobium haloflavum]|uniref:GntR family transcriptional regulator n=1 Tax=Pararhizobium haloflavum TaxID=2037914 RepID=UPI001FE1A466|nr:GntR family transcriptional regulator [Pararhizobium haloflavum]